MKAISAALLLGIAACVFVQPASAADTATYAEKVLHSFCSQRHCKDGANPFANLVGVNGVLYGTTTYGGRAGCLPYNGCGTVFALDPSTGVETVVYDFCRQPNCADGNSPDDRLLNLNGTLYGTAQLGGSGGGGRGTVFSLNASTGAETVIYSFCSATDCTDGAYPIAGVIAVNGTLYGTTQSGGSGYLDYGTAYSLDPNTGTEAVLHSFCDQEGCPDGWGPNPAPIYLNGTLYGVTIAGGAYSAGTVYSLNPGTGSQTVLHSFGGVDTDGQEPEAGLIAVNGTLYGTTYQGGGTGCGCAGCGTIFSINPSNGAETVLYSFSGGADGANPFASLIDVNGALFSATVAGGSTGCGGTGCGTVFSIDANTGAEAVLYSFLGGTDGANPYASLLHANRNLYGTTSAGGGTGCGGKGCGTVFSFDQSTGVETVLYTFMGGADGADPTAALVSIDGTLYGTTSAGGGTGCGGAGCGTVFELTKKTVSTQP